jgi:hypothetical protein
MPKYQCVQFGLCPRADACEEIVIKPGDSFQCARSSPDPKCREQLEEVRGRKPRLNLVLIAVPVALLLGIGAWIFMGTGSPPSSKASVEQLLVEVWPWLKNTP